MPVDSRTSDRDAPSAMTRQPLCRDATAACLLARSHSGLRGSQSPCRPPEGCPPSAGIPAAVHLSVLLRASDQLSLRLERPDRPKASAANSAIPTDVTGDSAPPPPPSPQLCRPPPLLRLESPPPM